MLDAKAVTLDSAYLSSAYSYILAPAITIGPMPPVDYCRFNADALIGLAFIAIALSEVEASAGRQSAPSIRELPPHYEILATQPPRRPF